MAKDLGMLPSQVEKNATTYDIMVLDVLNTYDNYMNQKQSGKLMDASAYGYTTDDLMKIKDKHKNGK